MPLKECYHFVLGMEGRNSYHEKIIKFDLVDKQVNM